MKPSPSTWIYDVNCCEVAPQIFVPEGLIARDDIPSHPDELSCEWYPPPESYLIILPLMSVVEYFAFCDAMLLGVCFRLSIPITKTPLGYCGVGFVKPRKNT